MAAYATVDDLKAKMDARALASLAYDAAGTAEITDAEVVANLENAIAAASARADTFLRGRVTLPLTAPYDRALVNAVCELAIEELYLRRPKEADFPREDALAEAKSFLEYIRAGIAKIEDAAAAVPECSIRSTTEGATPVFSTVKDVMG